MTRNQNWQAGLKFYCFQSSRLLFLKKTSSTFFNFLLTSYSFPLAAMNMENLEGDYYVPGNELDLGDGVWKEIQAIQDYEKKVPKGASSKQKAGCPNHVVF